MEVILCQEVVKLGSIGDVVKVKDGYARNYLIPKKLAWKATASNLKRVELQKAKKKAEDERLKNEALELAEKLNKDSTGIKVLVPKRGWSEADRPTGPLYDPEMNQLFLERFKELLNSQIEIREVDHHINDLAFGRIAAMMMDRMVRSSNT